METKLMYLFDMFMSQLDDLRHIEKLTDGEMISYIDNFLGSDIAELYQDWINESS